MKDIGVQTNIHNVVGVHLSPLFVVLYVDNHYTQQSTLALFII